jgi:hypothetical protein
MPKWTKYNLFIKETIEKLVTKNETGCMESTNAMKILPYFLKHGTEIKLNERIAGKTILISR